MAETADHFRAARRLADSKGPPLKGINAMHTEAVIEQLFNILVNGDRPAVRRLVGRILVNGMTPDGFANDIVWPLHETLFRLHRADQIAPFAFNSALRLLRTTIDQLQAGYTQAPRRGRSVLLFGGREEIEDLGAQIAADLLEADGWDVRFGGPMVALDDLLTEVNSHKPAWLVLYSAHPKEVTSIREVIDTLRDLGGHPDLRIAVGGGVFNRAPGLAEEMGAPHSASTPRGLVELLAGRSRSEASVTVDDFRGKASSPQGNGVVLDQARERGAIARGVDPLRLRKSA